MATKLVHKPRGSVIASPRSESSAAEVGSIGAELARTYKADAEFYMRHLGLSASEADARVRGFDMTPEQAATDVHRIQTCPHEQVSWADLQRVANRDPDELAAVWEGLKVDAREELASGHRAGQSMDWQGTPWGRARFLAVRESFRQPSRPTGGIEAALLDTAAEAYCDYLQLSEGLRRQLNANAEVEREDIRQKGSWHPPHRVVEETIRETERRVERAHKRLLQTVKMLHELQRVSPRLYVTHADQVNVGQQQVNMTANLGTVSSEPTDLPE